MTYLQFMTILILPISLMAVFSSVMVTWMHFSGERPTDKGLQAMTVMIAGWAGIGFCLWAWGALV